VDVAIDPGPSRPRCTQTGASLGFPLMPRAKGRPGNRFQTRRLDRLVINDAMAVRAVLDSFEGCPNLSEHLGVGLREHQVLVAHLVKDRLIQRVGLIGRLARRLNVPADLSFRLLLQLEEALPEPLDINSTLPGRVCHIAIR